MQTLNWCYRKLLIVYENYIKWGGGERITKKHNIEANSNSILNLKSIDALQRFCVKEYNVYLGEELYFSLDFQRDVQSKKIDNMSQ